ncbi:MULTISPECIES: LLM class flavin-dependent oxidoreductase [Amycolatopsis]|uniref:Flavin-dependent oxidoreductase, luciferase family (Includes alkanesulfonate monooxygenase SsuD and methylene tetrahydromethanopterin reductase) n=2 Tax=Amycolatopsis TaxID=1813 RepID=A0A1I3ZXH5_9PSEU|nr:LLM class flavin-dependent oxidoreductase [Amycolatopsis sacchari]SFK48822.1 Flavin-dependent oxidoreductase, luciferase family (includes alkanesulfonate monooxygenase SsuD and methylene tetrahydromethanopterin reductase) [Amycolatopsis sacchari]
MRIGIGIPNTVPGVTGPLILDWARRAEERGFAFVSTIGRVGYPSYDSLTALAAVAGATTRLGLMTNAVLGPTYPDAVLAKITMTVAQLSGGRLTLGLGVGARESDYLPAERDFASRGAAFDRQLEFLHRAWRGEPVATGDFPGEQRPVAPPGEDVPVLIGGHGKRAVRRTARWGAGWTGAGGGPRRAEPTIKEIRQAWQDAGREGEPRLLGLAYFSADDSRADDSDRYLRSYYAYAGDHANTIAEGAVRTPSAIRGILRDFESVGCNELTFTPTLADVSEVDRLADLVL